MCSPFLFDADCNQDIFPTRLSDKFLFVVYALAIPVTKHGHANKARITSNNSVSPSLSVCLLFLMSSKILAQYVGLNK